MKHIAIIFFFKESSESGLSACASALNCNYCSLLAAMIAGRLVWGAAMFVFVGAQGGSFTFSAFLAGAITNALPGIIVQIILIPILVMILDSPKILKLRD